MPGSATISTACSCRMRAASIAVTQELELVLAPDDRDRVDLGGLAPAGRRAHVVGDHGPLLALDEQRLAIRGVDRARAIEHVRCRKEIARLAHVLSGEPRG